MKTVEDLMKLVASLSGWGQESCTVSVRYMPARKYDSYGDSEIDYKDWGFVVCVEICGTGSKVSAEGKTLDSALLKLAKAIPEQLKQSKRYYEDRIKSTTEALDKFLEEL